MNSNCYCQIIGRVSTVKSGTTKTGNPWLLCVIPVRVFNFSARKYESIIHNCWFGGKIVEKVQEAVQVGTIISAAGTHKPGKPMKTNEGEIPTIDLSVTSWFDCTPREGAQPAEKAEEDESNPFGE
jgi:hypothetical protein